MEKIIISNNRTFRRNIRRTTGVIGTLGLTIAAGIVSAAVTYGGYLGLRNGGAYAGNKYAYYRVSKATEKLDFSNASTLLENSRDIFSEDQVSELEARVQGIHPKNLYEQAKVEEDVFRKVDLFKSAYNGFCYLGETPKGFYRDYTGAFIDSISRKFETDTPKLKVAKKDIETFVESGALIADPSLTKNFDRLFGTFAECIRGYGTKDETGEIEGIFEVSDRLVELFQLSDRSRNYYGKLLEAWADQLNNRIQNEKMKTKDKLKAFGKLKEYEIWYGYQVKNMDIVGEMLGAINDL